MSQQSSRYSRQEDIVVLDRIQKDPITVVGLGAIGREIAIKLSQMGADKLILIDFDEVEEPNICTQGYREEDIGTPKVEATQKACKAINNKAKIITKARRFSRAMEPTPVIFCCVDSMEARKLIWETVRSKVRLFVDTRMSAETLRILTVLGQLNHDVYEDTLFTDEEAHQDSCTAKATCYCASIAAGLAVSNLSKWTREMDNVIDKDITLNILTSEIMLG